MATIEKRGKNLVNLLYVCGQVQHITSTWSKDVVKGNPHQDPSWLLCCKVVKWTITLYNWQSRDYLQIHLIPQYGVHVTMNVCRGQLYNVVCTQVSCMCLPPHCISSQPHHIPISPSHSSIVWFCEWALIALTTLTYSHWSSVCL